MYKVVDTGITPSKGPVSGTTKAGNLVFMASVPKDPKTGDIIQGDIKTQTRRTLQNLEMQIKGAGGSLKDIAQVLIYLTDGKEAAAMNEVYREFFSAPYPNRATVVVKELLAPGMKIELVAHGVIGPA